MSTSASVVPVPQEVVLDDRGHALRATWHRDQRLLVLSTWHEGTCTSSVRLAPADAARLGACIIAALADAADELPQLQHQL
jgi:hypothetical protein